MEVNIGNILKIKENFPKLSNKKIEEINKSIFGKTDKPKPKINMTTRGSLCKQIIIPMSMDNINKFMSASSKHVSNFNQSLRNTKSDLSVDFIYVDHWDLIITLNRVISPSEISIISNYIKNCSNINPNNIQDTCLPQSKSYLKILSTLYILEDTNMPINSETIVDKYHTSSIMSTSLPGPMLLKFPPSLTVKIAESGLCFFLFFFSFSYFYFLFDLFFHLFYF